METVILPKTLRDLREERGLSHQQLMDAVAACTDEPAKHWTASVQYERRGLNRFDVIEALAKVYALPVEAVREAALNSARLGLPDHAKRKRQS